MSTKRLFRRSTGFVLAGIATIAVVWLGIKGFTNLSLKDFKLNRIEPGEINLLAVEQGAGYRIIVSNGTAHLVEASDDSKFESSEDNKFDSQEAGRLPIRETLKCLQGDADALGKMVMSVNKMKQDDLPTVMTIWTAENLQKALDGDSALVSKLEKDLNTKLDGTPLESVSLNAIINGIVIDAPVTVQVPVGGKLRSIVCRVQEPYKTLFAASIEKVVDNTFNISQEKLIGNYREKANAVLQNGNKENVASSIRSHIDSKKLQEMAVGPEKIMSHLTILINESHMKGASFDSYQGPNRSILSNVRLRLSEEGRMRLWKYSHDNLGFQLLLTVNGVAISAPRITTELAESEVNLTKIPSKDQVEEAVNAINKMAEGKKAK